MEKIEFTNPESKELNEEVRNYLELIWYFYRSRYRAYCACDDGL